MFAKITIIDLEQGLVARLKAKTVARLLDESESTLSRKRHNGTGLPYYRDELGQIFYNAEDVLKELRKPKYTSTSNYPHDGIKRMAVARAARKSA